MTIALLSTTYFGPVQWYQKLYRYDRVQIEVSESFTKQTYRNRCLIATTQGVQALTVPVKAPSDFSYSVEGDASEACEQRALGGSGGLARTLISDHGNWRHLHWMALQSAYGDSPFFEYYEDDLRPFFTEHRWERLIDFNEDIRRTVCELLDIHPHVEYTTAFRAPQPDIPSSAPSSASPVADFRFSITPKHPLPDSDFQPRPYYQVFRSKHGFLPNLSILDLLFNMGPESIFYL